MNHSENLRKTKVLSTSNLRAPDFDRLWGHLLDGFSSTGELEEGALVRKLERRLCDYHDSKFCVSFSTGFWALVALAKLKAIPGRSEIIIPSFTYRRLADVIFWTGHTPVFADIEKKNLAISPASVTELISDQTALILAVHPIVNCCPVHELMDIAEQKHIPVAFDAVESVHETFRGQRIGSFGVGEVFSLHASKLINGLEGGYVCTNSSNLRDSLIRFREGQNTEFETVHSARDARQELSAGLPGQPLDAHAAFALSELEEIEANVKHNRDIYRTYQQLLNSIDGIELLEFDESEQTSFKNIVVEISPEFPVSRDQMIDALNDQQILARAHYSPPLHLKTYRYSVKTGNMSDTEWAMNRLANLPCGSRVTVDDVRLICEFLQSFASS